MSMNTFGGPAESAAQILDTGPTEPELAAVHPGMTTNSGAPGVAPPSADVPIWPADAMTHGEHRLPPLLEMLRAASGPIVWGGAIATFLTGVMLIRGNAPPSNTGNQTGVTVVTPRATPTPTAHAKPTPKPTATPTPRPTQAPTPTPTPTQPPTPTTPPTPTPGPQWVTATKSAPESPTPGGPAADYISPNTTIQAVCKLEYRGTLFYEENDLYTPAPDFSDPDANVPLCAQASANTGEATSGSPLAAGLGGTGQSVLAYVRAHRTAVSSAA